MRDLVYPAVAQKRTNLKYDVNTPRLCGWGPTTESEIFSKTLNCINVMLYTAVQCHAHLIGVDFKDHHYCGDGEESQRITTVIPFKNMFLYFCLLVH